MASPIKNSNQGGKRPGQKYKSLLVWQYLLKKTDEDHAASSEDIGLTRGHQAETQSQVPLYDPHDRANTVAHAARPWKRLPLKPFPTLDE